MKKLLIKLLVGILAVTTLIAGVMGCSSSASWKGTTMTDWGDGNIVGGFIGEKANYYYYINGVGVSTEDNSFGAPVKGALMAVSKDFTKTEVVVPKLFVASDYKAGLYIYGDYVYYGTPNTDKNSSGDVANNELTFMKTKLDGSESEKLFTLSSLSEEYRIVEKDSVVYIVYYDSVDTALEVYNCTDKTVSTIAKTDATVAGANAESLNAYKFAENGNDVVVYYTTTVYAEDVFENKTDERAKASYNKVYAYKAGDDVTKQTALLDGKDSSATYEIKMIKFGELFYSETINAKATVYVGTTQTTKTKIYNESALAETNVFNLDQNTGLEVYILTEGVVSRTSLFQSYNAATVNVAKIEGATALLAKNGDYLYFTDAESGVSRIYVGNDKTVEQNVEKVSENTVYTSWYPVQFIGNKMFYCDNSSIGASYIKYVDLTQTATAEDTDDDGENDKFYLVGQTALGQITDTDKVSIATARVNEISSKLVNGALPFEKNDDGSYKKDANGEIYVQAIIDVKAKIAGIELSEETEELLAQYENAVKKANLYYKLEGIRSDLNQISYLNAYNEVKAGIQAFRASEDYSTVSAYIETNLLWNYEKAMNLFEPEE